MKICETYKIFLLLADIESDKDGFLFCNSTGDKPVQVMLKKKRLRLPTSEALGDPSDSTIIFHPFIETSNRGVSPTLEKYIRLASLNMALKMAFVITKALEEAAKGPSNATTEKMEVLSKIKGCDEKTSLLFFGEALKAIEKPKIDSSVIRLTLKRNSTINNEQFHRVANISMPFFKDFVKESKAFRKTKDVGPIIAAAKALFPITYSGKASSGSRSSQAPYSESVLRGLIEVAKEINDAIALFDLESEVSLVELPVELMDLAKSISKISKLISLVPIQSGNEGVSHASLEERIGSKKMDEVKKRLDPKPLNININDDPDSRWDVKESKTRKKNIPEKYDNPEAREEPKSKKRGRLLPEQSSFRGRGGGNNNNNEIWKGSKGNGGGRDIKESWGNNNNGSWGNSNNGSWGNNNNNGSWGNNNNNGSWGNNNNGSWGGDGDGNTKKRGSTMGWG